MNHPPPPPEGKFAQAIALWLFACFISLPLWQVAAFILHDLRFGLFHSLMRHFLNPAETFLGAMIMVGFEAMESRGGSFFSWPPMLIAAAFTASLLRSWWRPIP